MTHAAPRLHLDSPVRVEKVDPTRWDFPPKKKTHQPKKKGGLEKTVGSIYVLYMYYYIIYYAIPNKKLYYISKRWWFFGEKSRLDIFGHVFLKEEMHELWRLVSKLSS